MLSPYVEIKVNTAEALAIINIVQGNDSNQVDTLGTAMDMLEKERFHVSVETLCPELDAMLGKGVSIGKITEFCGAPGIGKTQLAIQLCVNAQIPAILGGAEGEAIYIDSEGSFIVERAAQIAQAMIDTVQCRARQYRSSGTFHSAASLTKDGVLSRIHYFRVHDYAEQVALICLLDEIVEKRLSKVKLIVVDSIAFHFRHEFSSDVPLRNRLLNNMAQRLMLLASCKSLAVVLMNQMTTKLSACHGNASERRSYLAPALGESWGHASTMRVIMFWQGNSRNATLYKSPTHEGATIAYDITSCGVRSTLKKKNNDTAKELDMPLKRVRTY